MKILLLAWVCTVALYGESIEGLLQKLKQQNLLLQESQDYIEIAKVRAEFADTWQNPSLTLGANDLLLEDFTARDIEPMQTHYITLSQKIPTAGKKHLKKRIALMDKELADLSYHDRYLQLQSQLMDDVYQVAIVDKKLALIKKYQQNVAKLKRLYVRNFKIGKSTQSSIQKSKILSQKLIVKKQRLRTKKHQLLNHMEKLVFDRVGGVEVALKMDQSLDVQIENHPIMIALALKVKRAKERVKLKRAFKVPDIKVGVGYFQRVDRSDYLSFNAGVSLPFRGKEEREVEIALLELHQAQTLFTSKRFMLQKEVEILKKRLKDAEKNYTLIYNQILPNQRYIQKLLHNELFTKNISIAKLLENLNETISLELEAYDALANYFRVLSKLHYFQGDLS
jgi:outer membrane protein TolC